MLFEEAFTSFVSLLDAIAVGVFAIAGALVACRKEMDIFGFALPGTVTGGGTIRDLLLVNLSLFWVKSLAYVAIALTVSATPTSPRISPNRATASP